MRSYLCFFLLLFLTACTGNRTIGGDGVPVTGVKSEKRYELRIVTSNHILGVGYAENQRRIVQIYDRSSGELIGEVGADQSSDGSRLQLAGANFNLAVEDYTQLTTVNTNEVKYAADINLGTVVIQDDYFTTSLPSGLGGRVLDCAQTASTCTVTRELDPSWFDLSALSFYLTGNGTGAVSTAINAILDASANLFTGTATDGSDGSFVYTEAPVNSGLDFDGINDVIEFGVSAADLSISGSAAKSFVGWVNPKKSENTVYKMNNSATCGSQIALKTRSVDGDWELDMKCSSRRLMFKCGKLNTWSHIAVVINGDNAKAYCNGLLAGENTITTRSLIADELSIGFANGSYFHGKLDDLSIWSKALSAEEVFIIYTQQNPVVD